MDAAPQKNHYHKIGKFGRGTVDRIERLNAHQLDILFFLFIHGTLPTNVIHSLVDHKTVSTGREVKVRTTTDNLFEMKHAPNKLVFQPPRQYDAENARHSFLVFELTERGAHALLEYGRITHSDLLLWLNVQKQYKPQNYLHDLGTSYITASFELGCRALGYRFISWLEILRDAPRETQDDDVPLGLPIELDGKAHMLIPDQLLGIDYGSGVRRCAIETDMKTEQHQEKFNKKTGVELESTLRKFRWYREAIRTNAAKKRWGIDRIIPIFATNSVLRMHNMKTKFEGVAKTDAKGSTAPFLFQALPILRSLTHDTLPADGNMLTTPYHQIGGRMFDLSKE